MSPLAVLFGLLMAASTAYFLLALAAAVHFRRARSSIWPVAMTGAFCPPVSILKPVRGRDADFYACIRSHAALAYPEFELLFAVRDPGDPAVEDIRRLIAEFPARRIAVFFTDCDFGPNDKVNGLERLRRECRGEVLVVSDSDVMVSPDYLAQAVAPLEDPAVGLGTCVYRGAPQGGLAALLEALWISTDFHPGVLVARFLGISFALGATIALRRKDLDQIGGFGPLAAYLADDYLLGQAISHKAGRIVVSNCVVETVLPRENWFAAWRHRMRWNRTLRVCRPAGYTGLLVTFAFPLAIGGLTANPALWPLAVSCLGLRLLTAWLVGWRNLRDRTVTRYFWLLPVSDVLSFFLWLASFFGRRIEWRGTSFVLATDGRLTSLPASH